MADERNHNAKEYYMRKIMDEARLLTPAEVAELFRVDPKTVTRWAKAGTIRSVRTIGGHRRYREVEIPAFLDGEPGRVNES